MSVDMDVDIDLTKTNNKFETNKISEESDCLIETCNDNRTSRSPIQDFYKNQCIFITGGTGFLGKILIQKLLRSCPDISRIYLLVRSKKGKNVETRIQELLKDPVFQTLKDLKVNTDKKIIGIPGDCSLKELGLSDSDKKLLIDEVSIVFHVAATVRFDQPLTEATAINIQSTSSVIEMCKDMQKLKSFIYVSTAYANCFNSTIEEKFYDYSIHYEDILQLQKSLSDNEINKSTTELIGSWPNTYAFTKALSEDLIRNKNKNLPMGIFRPGIVISTAKEPVAGWIDNYYGPTGIFAAGMTGILRTMRCDKEKIANVVPVDLTVNALIASAWDVAVQTKSRDENMLIYNFISSVEAPITWGAINDNVKSITRDHPPENAMWYYTLTSTKHKVLYYLYSIFLHVIPCNLIDFGYRLIGEKARLGKTYQRIHKLTDALTFFSMNEWKFTNDNVQSMWQRLDSNDREIFHFSMQNFNWQTYFTDYVKGIKTFLLKSEIKSSKANQEKSTRLYWNHHLLVMFLLIVMCWIFWKMLSIIF